MLADTVDYEVLKARQTLFHRAVAQATPWVVAIQTIGGAQPQDGAGQAKPKPKGDDGTPPEENVFRETLGSDFLVADGPTTGIIYESDGWILTSSFNFVRDPSHVTVHLADGRRFVAKLVARDKVRKLAMLKIDATDLPTPDWVPTDEVRVGQSAIALGRGFGGDRPSVTVGVISALNRMMGNAVQTDAKLSPANYGGPLIDLAGRCIGICAPMAQRPGELAGVEFYDAGVGFAVPTDRVHAIAADLKKGTSFYRGWLGIQIDARFRGGLRIHRVANPSPAWDAGWRTGDVIVQANEQTIRNINHLRKAIYMVPAGEWVRVVVRRHGLDSGYEIELAASPDLGRLEEAQAVLDPGDPLPFLHRPRSRWEVP